MKANQLNRGNARRLMYVENKSAPTEPAPIGWVRFSKSGRSLYYRDKVLLRANVATGNFVDLNSSDEYWVSGVKQRGSNTHYAEAKAVQVDEDAKLEHAQLRS